jgi:hypothetical protein
MFHPLDIFKTDPTAKSFGWWDRGGRTRSEADAFLNVTQ